MAGNQKQVLKLCPNPQCEAQGSDMQHRLDEVEGDRCAECGASLHRQEIPMGLISQERDQDSVEITWMLCRICLTKFPEWVYERTDGGLFDFAKCPNPECGCYSYVVPAEESDHDGEIPEGRR